MNIYSPVSKEGIPNYPKGSKEYNNYWKLQIDRCLNGYKPSGGVHINGAYYFYLNFYSILARNENTNRKKLQNPWYRDLDHEYFDAIYNAKENGEGIIVLKARDKGFSYMNSALCLYEWTFFRNNEIGVGAPTPAYVNSFRQKIINAWNNLPEAIRPRKDLIDNEYKMMSGYKVKENGVWVEKGLKSIIHYRSMDNPEVFRGERLGMMIFEEAGEFKDLVRSYMSSEACFKDGAVQYGVPIIGGTSNSMNKSNDFMEMWYNCEKYNLKQIFIPATKALYGFFDKTTGKSDEESAVNHFKDRRKILLNSKDKTAYYLHIQEYPLVPEDAFMQSNRSPFDLEKINTQIGKILADKHIKGLVQTGNLHWKNKNKFEVEWELDPHGKFKVIYHPDKSRQNLDIGAVDSYYNNEAPNSASKGCAMVFRRWDNISDGETNLPIAMYYDRPYTKEEWYENNLKLFAYYNAKALVEYTDDGYFNYFINNQASKFLKERPKAADSPWSNVSNRFGVHMKSYQKNMVIDLIDDYIKKHSENIYFLELLEDLSNFGIKNTDMAITFGIALLHDTDNANIKIISAEELNIKDNYFLPTYKFENGVLKVVNSKNRNNPFGLSN